MLAKPQGFPRKLGGCAGLDPRLRSAVSAGVGDGERGLRRGLRAPGVGVRPKWVLEYSPSNKRIRYFVSITYVRTGLWTAHKFCGGGQLSNIIKKVARIKPSWTVTESAQQAPVSLLSGKAGGTRDSVGTSKSFREQREALFQPREFGLLPNCQAICLPYDGTHATSAVRVYLKPYYLPETTPYWRAVEAGKI